MRARRSLYSIGVVATSTALWFVAGYILAYYARDQRSPGEERDPGWTALTPAMIAPLLIVYVGLGVCLVLAPHQRWRAWRVIPMLALALNAVPIAVVIAHAPAVDAVPTNTFAFWVLFWGTPIVAGAAAWLTRGRETASHRDGSSEGLPRRAPADSSVG